MNWIVPFFDLTLGEEEKAAVLSVLDSNWLTAGPKIAEFESEFGKALGGGEAVAVSSATAALHLSLIALGIQAGDEVILPSLTFVACANAVRYVGATPVFADVTGELDWNISPRDILAKITSRTRAVMVVHFAGYPCDMNEIVAICQQHNLRLIEDCSHALMANSQGNRLGLFGDVACFSFFSNKNLTTGEGGMVVTRVPALASAFRVLRSHGISSSTYQRFKGHSWGYDVDRLGYNYRLDEMRAALGLVQLRRLPHALQQRKSLVEHYRRRLCECAPDIAIPFVADHVESAYHIFPIMLPPNGRGREEIVRELAGRGIQTSVHYRPIHTFSAYGNNVADCPITDRIAPSIVTLPLFPSMSMGQVDMVVAALCACCK